jgi:hypothetical protein
MKGTKAKGLNRIRLAARVASLREFPMAVSRELA